MNATFVTVILVIAVGQDLRDRERHPLAPSLPRLTKEESAQIDAVIERFIQYDIGKLKGAAGKKALDDFNQLGSESFFNLVDGLNRAAEMEDSCPAVIIGKRVAKIITTTDDPHLLAFAKESIGAGVNAKRHRGTLQDLQAAILFRNAALRSRGITIASTRVMSRPELEKAIAKQSGPQLQLLVQKQPADLLKGLLKHERADVRIAAAKTVGAKKLRYGSELIGLLQDSDDDVRQAARRALAQIAGGVDHGPSPDASVSEREFAVARWREWWGKQK